MRNATVVMLALALAGCMTVGNRQIANKDVVSRIEASKTTKNEVVALVGQPTRVRFMDSGGETWEYEMQKSQIRGATLIPVIGLFAGGANIQTYSLSILFRPDGIVEKVGSGSSSGGGGSLSDEGKVKAAERKGAP